MQYIYKALDPQGTTVEGTIEAINRDVAINSLQGRGLVIISINSTEEKVGIFKKKFTFLQRVKNKDVVILSRQIATLFSAQVSALRVFRLLATESENPALGRVLVAVADDIQGGSNISKALTKHPKVFSSFYVNMVRAGEESGKLDESFLFLADYLDRNYTVTSKAKNALIYPAFVIFTFVAVMSLMLTVVIPKISSILKDAGQDVPVYTKIVIGLSDFMAKYWWLLGFAIIFVGFFIWKAGQGERGSRMMADLKLSIPYVGSLYKKLYLSRIADNVNTLLVSGVPMVKVLELTADVVDNKIYEDILRSSLELVKAGSSLSDAFSRYPEIPSIMVQMAKVGEETGELGSIFKTLANFYQREVVNAVDTLVDLIEPVMIVTLGLGVAFLLASVLIPIYNLSSAI